jgi:hypothetical protein
MGGVEAVFKSYADTVKKNAKGADQALGLSGNAYRELATVIGSQLKNAGVPMEELGVSTDALIKQGADLSAMFGGTTQEAVNALSSALKGEMDPIERYGISLNDAALKAEAMSLGLYSGKGNLDANAKAMAVMSLVTKQGADSVGAFGRESETAAGKQARATAQWENLKTALGDKLLPAFTNVMGFINEKALPGLEKLGGIAQQTFNILFKGDFTGGGPLSEDGTVTDKLFKIRDAFLVVKDYAVQVFDILFRGDFTGGPLAEDSVTVDILFRLRDGFIQLKDTFLNDVIPAMSDTWKWFKKHEDVIQVIAGIILTLYIPHWIALAVASVVNSVKVAASWVVTQAAAIAAGVIHSAQVVAMVAGWVVVAVQSTINAVRVAASWVVTQAAAIAAGSVHAVQVAGQVAGWLLLGVQSLVHALKVAASWVVTQAAAIAAAGIHAVQVARIVAGWVFMGTQSMIQAARMAAAWIVAMGPVAWVIALVVGLVALIIANWDKISAATSRIWTALTGKIKELAGGVRDWVVGKFNDLKDRATEIFTSIRDKVGEIWSGIQEKVKAPLRIAFRFVNDNMIDPVNAILKQFPGGLKIPHLPALASGGLLRGPGTGTSDSILGVDPKTRVPTAAVSNGEFVVNAKATRENFGLISAINAGKRIAGLATGGLAGRFGVPAFGLGGFIGEVFDKAKNAVSTVKNFATDMISKGARKAAEMVLGPVVDAAKATIPNKVPLNMLSGGLDKIYQAILGKGDEQDKEQAALSGGKGFGGSAASPNGVGGLGPQAVAARAYALSHFQGIASIGGYSYRKIAGTNTLSDHATGKALDIMMANYKSAGAIANGNKIASYFVDNPGAFGTKYVIWRDAINQGSGWKPYGHPGGGRSDTLQHRDHVHVSLYDDGGLLEPGTTVVQNKSGKPEAVLTNQEMQDYKRLIANGSGSGGDITLHLTIDPSKADVRDQVNEAMFQLRKIKRGGLHA